MDKTRGFITIATGKDEYYVLAQNLLRSYRYFSKESLPFAILCDRKNTYTENFDDVIAFEATNSYLDKLRLGEYLPYDETIFIDADCLAYGDLNQLFAYFQGADGFSCFGRVLPIGDKTGWFEYENLGDLKGQVSYVVGLHGGIYYMRKGEVSRKIFASAKNFVADYENFQFKGKFSTPGDEPLVALSMAVNGCHPIPFALEGICCYWEHVGNMKIDITKGLARVKGKNGYDTILLHWGTRYTRQLEYKKQVALLDIKEKNKADQSVQIIKCKLQYNIKMAIGKGKRFVIRVVNKIKRTIKKS